MVHTKGKMGGGKVWVAYTQIVPLTPMGSGGGSHECRVRKGKTPAAKVHVAGGG